MRRKTLVAWLLALLLMSTLCPAALAEGEAEPEKFSNAEGYVYTLNEDGAAQIVGYTGQAQKLVVPAELDGHTVVALGNRAFYSLDQLTEVQLPDTLRYVGKSAFGWCSKLQTIAFADGLETIESYAFWYCQKLTKLNLPDSVTTVMEAAFGGCDALQTVTLSPEHPVLAVTEGVLFNKETGVLLWYPAARSGREYQAPEGTRRIGAEAFYHSKLEKIVLPESVEELASSSISGCDKLKTFNVPSKITKMDDVISACDHLEAIEVSPENEVYESIDGVLFDKTTHTLIKYPAVKRGSSYTVPEGTEAIAAMAFDAAGLNEIVLPESLRVIGSNAFRFCKNLRTLALPEGIEAIDSFAFQYCTSMERFVLPLSLRTLGANPFLHCEKLKEIVAPEDHPVLALVNGCLVLKEEMTIVTCPETLKEQKLEFPDGIRAVGDDAFEYCKGIQEIVFGEGLETIGTYAFHGCDNLKRLTLPATVTEINRSAFDLSKVRDNAIFVVIPGSYAENFCTAYELKVETAQ